MSSANNGGVWIAYYSDGSGVYAFATETEALRFAVAWSCSVRFAKWGEDCVTGRKHD